MRQLKRAYPGKVGTGFPKRICANSSAHIPEKWAPVFRKGYAPTQERISRKSGHRFSEKDMRQLKSAYPGKVGTSFPKRICANSRSLQLEKSGACPDFNGRTCSHGQSTRRVPRARSKRDGCRKALGIKTSAVRQFCERTDVLRRMRVSSSLATFDAAWSIGSSRGSYPRGRPFDSVRCNQYRGMPIRTGWCRRCAVNAVPSGKRFDSVHSPPCGRSWKV